MKISVKAVVIMMFVFLVSCPAFAGRSDGVTYSTWKGWGEPISKADIQFADFRVGKSSLLPDEAASLNANIYLLNIDGSKYSGLAFDYPTPGNTVDCSGVINMAEDFTLGFSQSGYWQSGIWEKVTITFPDTGIVRYQSLLLGDSNIHLTAGKYNFLSEASASPVPEPGSIIALGSGLIGLVGFGIRRKK